MAIKHIGTKEIETKKLILRRVEEGDAILYAKINPTQSGK